MKTPTLKLGLALSLSLLHAAPAFAQVEEGEDEMQQEATEGTYSEVPFPQQQAAPQQQQQQAPQGWAESQQQPTYAPPPQQGAQPYQAPVQQNPNVQIEFEAFEQGLMGYGAWDSDPTWGRVFFPTVRLGWRPYLDGRWLWTQAGWTWMSAEPFGWATFHYGRWFFSRSRGAWGWVPGYEWAPAWVTWRWGASEIGWAPLYAGYDGWVDGYPVFYDHWNYVPCNRFWGGPVGAYVYTSVQVQRSFWATRSAGGWVGTQGYGPGYAFVQQHAASPIPTTQLNWANQPGYRAPGADGSASFYRPPQLPVYSPSSVAPPVIRGAGAAANPVALPSYRGPQAPNINQRDLTPGGYVPPTRPGTPPMQPQMAPPSTTPSYPSMRPPNSAPQAPSWNGTARPNSPNAAMEPPRVEAPRMEVPRMQQPQRLPSSPGYAPQQGWQAPPQMRQQAPQNGWNRPTFEAPRARPSNPGFSSPPVHAQPQAPSMPRQNAPSFNAPTFNAPRMNAPQMQMQAPQHMQAPQMQAPSAPSRPKQSAPSAPVAPARPNFRR